MFNALHHETVICFKLRPTQKPNNLKSGRMANDSQYVFITTTISQKCVTVI